MAEGSICRKCFHSYVCEQFNEHKEHDNTKCHFFNDHFVPAADVVEVVRCKDCIHFQPCFVMTEDGDRRPYTEGEIKKGKMVTGDIGINCGSRCERFGYWEENKIPVWYSEDDFCSYGKRRDT